MKKPENKLIEVYYSCLWLINLFVDLVSYKDPEVCHYYVCGFCPHELFVNTRADLGPCKKIHDEAIRKEYQVNYYGLYHHPMLLVNMWKFYVIQLYGQSLYRTFSYKHIGIWIDSRAFDWSKIFQTSEDVFKLGYEERFYDFLTDCVVEVERRIKRNKMRLDSTNGRSDSNETPVRISQFIQSDFISINHLHLMF